MALLLGKDDCRDGMNTKKNFISFNDYFIQKSNWKKGVLIMQIKSSVQG